MQLPIFTYCGGRKHKTAVRGGRDQTQDDKQLKVRHGVSSIFATGCSFVIIYRFSIMDSSRVVDREILF